MSFHCTKLWFWRDLDMHSYNINVIITILLVLRPWIVSRPTAFIAFQSTTTCIWYAIWASFLLAWLCTFIFLVNLYPSGSINTEIIKKYVLARKLLLDMTQTFEQIMVIMKKKKENIARPNALSALWNHAKQRDVVPLERTDLETPALQREIHLKKHLV